VPPFVLHLHDYAALGEDHSRHECVEQLYYSRANMPLSGRERRDLGMRSIWWPQARYEVHGFQSGQWMVREPSTGGQLSFPVRSYSRETNATVLQNTARGRMDTPAFTYGLAQLFEGDCLDWLAAQDVRSIHAVVTDPPSGLIEYSADQQAKLRRRRGGVWRIPPSFDGHRLSPLPRFTTLTDRDLSRLEAFFFDWATALYPVLMPGAHVVVASNPLLSYIVSTALTRAGLERGGWWNAR
jgi:hypothetical protein